MTAADPNLLVPIDVRALVCTDAAAQQTWADLTPRYGLLDAGVTLGDQLAPEPFAARVAAPEPGVHLHWAMPDALTHGTQGDHGTAYPLLPNRWLVVRLWDAGRGVQARARIVISDALGDTDPGGSTPWPVREQDATYRCAYLGRAIDVADWDDDDDGPPPMLTAVGPGDPLFAAS